MSLSLTYECLRMAGKTSGFVRPVLPDDVTLPILAITPQMSFDIAVRNLPRGTLTQGVHLQLSSVNFATFTNQWRIQMGGCGGCNPLFPGISTIRS